MKRNFNCPVIIKRDAIEDGVAENVLALLSDEPQIEILTQTCIRLTTEDAVQIYLLEADQNPDLQRHIILAMAAIAMAGSNIVAGLKIRDVFSLSEALKLLKRVKGGLGSQGTVRGSFPYPKPANFDELDIWFQAPFFVRSRLHTPDTAYEAALIENIAAIKGIQLYSRAL